MAVEDVQAALMAQVKSAAGRPAAGMAVPPAKTNGGEAAGAEGAGPAQRRRQARGKAQGQGQGQGQGQSQGQGQIQAAEKEAGGLSGGFELFSSMRPPTEQQARELTEGMPWLAGQPIEAPRFHQMKWRNNQRFTEQDDPDRTQEPWAPPQFCLDEDPSRQRARTTAEQLPIVRGSYPSRFASVVRGVLGEESCAALISSVNVKGFTPALLNVGRGVQQLTPEVRDGHRVIVDSPQLALWLLEVLRPHLPEELEDGSRLVELNERLRFLCYTPGQAFEEHCDGCYIRPANHPRAGDRSRITVQLYLHDIPEPCGGATTFFPGRTYSAAHQPEVGSVLLFTQDLLHEGTVVRSGLKYTLRTEAMYTKKKDDAPAPPRWAPAAAAAAGAAHGSG